MSNSTDFALKPNPIYGALDVTQDHPDVYGDPFFGVYAKPAGEPHKLGVRANFSWVADLSTVEKKSPVKFNASIDQGDLKSLTESMSRQDILLFNGRMIGAALKSEHSFVDVSKEDLAKAIYEGFQTPQGAVYAALSAMASVTFPASKGALITEVTETSRIAGVAYGLSKNDFEGVTGFCISAQEFRSGDFSANPLTADEIRAIPALIGFYKEVYDIAGLDHDYASHAVSVTKKLQDAGFPVLAAGIAKLNNIELKAERPVRKHDLDDGPGF